MRLPGIGVLATLPAPRGLAKAGHTVFQGLPIHIEHDRGETRSGTSPDGERWTVDMVHPYGEILGTLAVDGDPLDCVLGPNRHATHAYVVQAKLPGSQKFDEPKICLGWDTQEEALRGFRANYDKPGFVLDVTKWPMAALIDLVHNHRDLQGGKLDDDARDKVLAMRKGLELRPSKVNPRIRRWQQVTAEAGHAYHGTSIHDAAHFDRMLATTELKPRAQLPEVGRHWGGGLRESNPEMVYLARKPAQIAESFHSSLKSRAAVGLVYRNAEPLDERHLYPDEDAIGAHVGATTPAEVRARQLAAKEKWRTSDLLAHRGPVRVVPHGFTLGHRMWTELQPSPRYGPLVAQLQGIRTRRHDDGERYTFVPATEHNTRVMRQILSGDWEWGPAGLRKARLPGIGLLSKGGRAHGPGLVEGRDKRGRRSWLRPAPTFLGALEHLSRAGRSRLAKKHGFTDEVLDEVRGSPPMVDVDGRHGTLNEEGARQLIRHHSPNDRERIVRAAHPDHREKLLRQWRAHALHGEHGMVDRVVEGDRSGKPGPSLENQILAAHLALAKYPDSFVRLADLRDRLSHVPRSALDQELERLYDLDQVILLPDDNTKDITQRDRDAALRLGNRERHLVLVRQPAAPQKAEARTSRRPE